MLFVRSRRKSNLRPVLAAVALLSCAIAAIGCESKDPTLQTQSQTTKAAPPPTPTQPKGDVAVVTTNFGQIRFDLLDNLAPKTVANFEKLAESKFYDGTKFHRVIPGFMIQGGDPLSKGTDRSVMGQGGPGYNIADEFSDTDFVRGIVAMANTGSPNSAGSQFFITVAPAPTLNGKYTAFGKVTQGMDVADKIVNLPRDAKDNPNQKNPAIIKSITIIHAPAK